MTFPESMMCTRCLNLTPVRATEERPNLGTSLNTTWSHREYENVLPGKKKPKTVNPEYDRKQSTAAVQTGTTGNKTKLKNHPDEIIKHSCVLWLFQ